MGTRSFLALMVVALCLGLLALWYFDTSRHYRLAIAAGQRTGQAFQIAKALQEVTHRHYPDVTIEVYETRGSLHNVRLIDNGAAQLATVQANQALGRKARLVAELYPDTFQIVVRRNSGIDTIGDLVDKRIALPPQGSGEFESFWLLAEHYELTGARLEVLTGTERTTDWLLINNDVDALFRVRAPGDPAILRLIKQIDGKVIAIPQASALRLKHPALETGIIPQGSYNGRPAIPQSDQPTISVKQLLVANESVPREAVAKITSVLFEHRQELIDLVPLAGSITAPARDGETFVPIHPGVRAFWDRDKPSFIQENAESIALMVSLAVIVTSIYLQSASRRRKRALDVYNRELIALARKARGAPNFAVLDQCNAELAEFVGRVVNDTEQGRISSTEFSLFNFTYDSVEDAIRDRQLQLERAERQNGGATTVAAKATKKLAGQLAERQSC